MPDDVLDTGSSQPTPNERRQMRQLIQDLRHAVTTSRILKDRMKFAAAMNLLGWVVSRFPAAEQIHLIQVVSALLPRYV